MVKKKIEKKVKEEVEKEITEIPPKPDTTLSELQAIHAGMTKHGIRDIGQLEVMLSRY